MQNMTSENRKLWDLLKGFLYLLSISMMVFLGYIREERNKAFIPNKKEQIILETEQEQFNDSVYFAFSPLFEEYSLNQN